MRTETRFRICICLIALWIAVCLFQIQLALVSIYEKPSEKYGVFCLGLGKNFVCHISPVGVETVNAPEKSETVVSVPNKVPL